MRNGQRMIHLVALITTKPGERAAVLTAFHDVIPAVRAEPGCIEYAPAVDATGLEDMQAPLGPDTFVVIEKWESADALRAHSAAPHMAAYGEKVKASIVGRVLHILSPA